MTKATITVFALSLLMPTLASAQSRRERGWLDVNFGVATSAQKTLTTEFNSAPDRGGERQTYRTTYNSPTGGAFDVGGGVMFTHTFGVGLAVSGTGHEGEADLFARIPHPVLLNRFGTGTSSTDDKLMKTEGTIHIMALAKLPIQNDRVRVRVFGGPSYFRLTADAVTDIRYFQRFQILGPSNEIEITSYDIEEFEATGWGFHAGADVSYMFTRVFGLGGFARFSRGTVTVSDRDISADADVDVKVGGLQAGGGIRLRF